MASNVFTKKEILQNLASRGYFIDIYTLDAFFAKKKVEAIFEDSQGNEFYDQNALNVVLEGLFASNSNQALNSAPVNNQIPQTPLPQMNTPIMPQMNTPVMPQMNTPIMPQANMSTVPPLVNTEPAKTEEKDAIDIIKDISLSDGTPLINKLDNITNINIAQNPASIADSAQQASAPSFNTANPQAEPYSGQGDPSIISNNLNPPSDANQFNFNPAQNALDETLSAGTEEITVPKDAFDEQNQGDGIFPKDDLFDAKLDGFSPDMSGDLNDPANFDDITLLSESLEAQEKLRQYVMSELSKSPSDVVPQSMPNSNEFKLDISERTLTMIARTMAKKIAKYVGSILAQDAKQSSKVEEYKEENRRLTQKTRDLEEQNRKLRLLLAESNKNLNSYKPSFFGLYKKIDPTAQNKK